MEFKRIRPGEYRAQDPYLPGVHIWVIRQRRRWYWLLGGYGDYDRVFAWETGGESGPFPSRRQAIADAIRELNR